MKLRAISAMLAASMMLSIVPAPAFAAGNYTGGNFPDQVTAQTLDEQNDEDPGESAANPYVIEIAEDGYPVDSNGGNASCAEANSAISWHFDDTDKTLYLTVGYFDFRGQPAVKCAVDIDYRAYVVGGTFVETVKIDSIYSILSGLFLKEPDCHDQLFSQGIRKVDLECTADLPDLQFTINGLNPLVTPYPGTQRFYFASTDNNYTQEISIECTGTDAANIRSWKIEGSGPTYQSPGTMSKSHPYEWNRGDSFFNVACQNGSSTQLKLSAAGQYGSNAIVTLTAQTTADPDAAYKATVPCATLYTEDDTGARQPLTDTSKVKPGTKVYIEYDETAAKEQYGEDFAFSGWELTGSVSLGDDFNITDENGWFTMPDDDVTLKLIVPDPDVPGEDPGDSSGVSPDGVAGAVVAGAVISATGYAAVTHVWLDSIFGFVPANRQQLALALWEKADKPQPQSSTLYSDISAEDADAQAAARWCAEQGLMKDFDEDFKPGHYVFRPQVIKAWNDLQTQLKSDK